MGTGKSGNSGESVAPAPKPVAVHIVGRGGRSPWPGRLLILCIVGAGAALLFWPIESPPPVSVAAPLVSGGPRPPEQAVTMYKWVDAAGEPRYSNTPPLQQGQTYERMDVAVGSGPSAGGPGGGLPPTRAEALKYSALRGILATRRAVRSTYWRVAGMFGIYPPADREIKSVPDDPYVPQGGQQADSRRHLLDRP